MVETEKISMPRHIGPENVALFGPWIGEFGWELMTWQSWCREEAKKFSKVYVCSFPDMAPLYRDFSEFIPHKHSGRALDWHIKENIDKVQFEIPSDVTCQILPSKCYKAPGEFIRFGYPTKGYNYLIHARGIGRGGKDYPLPLWSKLCSQLIGSVASIGSPLDHHIPGTADMRGIPLDDLMDFMAGADCVIGQSSGVMHLATLCCSPIVVWGDSRTYFGETLRERYTSTWNPFKTPVTFIFNDRWQPDPEEILRAVNARQVSNISTDFPDNIPSPAQHRNGVSIEDLQISRDVRNKLLQAVKCGKYFITISVIDRGKLYHYYKTQEFPTTDLLPSLAHLSNEVKTKELKPVAKNPVPQVIGEEEPKQTGIEEWT